MNCTPESGATLLVTISDPDPGVTRTMSHTFNQTDGVQDKVDYSCVVTLSSDGGNSSAQSPPILITSWDVPRKIPSHYRILLNVLIQKSQRCPVKLNVNTVSIEKILVYYYRNSISKKKYSRGSTLYVVGSVS